jgi:hypothetical protein
MWVNSIVTIFSKVVDNHPNSTLTLTGKIRRLNKLAMQIFPAAWHAARRMLSAVVTLAICHG